MPAAHPRPRGASLVLTGLLCLLATSQLAPSATAQRALELEPVAMGFQSPLQVLAAPDDPTRLFVVEQGGLVKIVRQGQVLGQPYLDLSGSTTAFVEQGLLGLAFHPDYAQNGWGYAHYTNLNGHTRVDRFTVDANDPDRVDPTSQVNVIGFDQPTIFHNGGTLAFGPDGYLYLGFGDGGGGGAPARDGQSFLGKVLRLDVSQQPYQIPPSNPFVGSSAVRDEIWAMGLRNPWRFSFDRETGDLWLADVGEGEWEEIDFVAAGSPGGDDFGWNTMEGPDCFIPSTGCNPAGLTLPFDSYQHGGSPYLCSITGGFVYRGESMATMHGRYFYGDYCSGQVFSVRRDAQGQPVDRIDHSADLGTVGQLVSFGEDAAGELYTVSLNGRIDRIVPRGLRLSLSDLRAGTPGELRVEGGTPGKVCYVGYSAFGVGQTVLGKLGLTIDLDRPSFAVQRPMNAAGNLVLPVPVPPFAQGLQIWVQVVHEAKVSNVVTQQID